MYRNGAEICAGKSQALLRPIAASLPLPLLNTATVCDRRCKHKRRTPNNTATGGSTVQVQAGCAYANGEKLANFSALITSEVERHEAGETTLQFAIAATHTTGLKSSAVVDANEGFR